MNQAKSGLYKMTALNVQFTLCGPSYMYKKTGEFAFFLQVMFLFVGITILLL